MFVGDVCGRFWWVSDVNPSVGIVLFSPSGSIHWAAAQWMLPLGDWFFLWQLNFADERSLCKRRYWFYCGKPLIFNLYLHRHNRLRKRLTRFIWVFSLKEQGLINTSLRPWLVSCFTIGLRFTSGYVTICQRSGRRSNLKDRSLAFFFYAASHTIHTFNDSAFCDWPSLLSV